MDDGTIAQLKRLKILCVEDEAGIRKHLVSTLRYYFGEVIEAANGEEGLDRFYESQPDIVLSDIEMPEENGVEMVKKIREINPKVPIVMVTAYSNEEYLLELINLQISYYILKPVNSNNLLEGIMKALEGMLDRSLKFAEGLYFDRGRGTLFYHGETVTLRKRDKQFLLLLYDNKQSVTTYEEIDAVIWADKSMSMGALKTFVKELRARLPIDIIENIPLEGYRLHSEE